MCENKHIYVGKKYWFFNENSKTCLWTTNQGYNQESKLGKIQFGDWRFWLKRGHSFMKSLPTHFLDLKVQFCETIINGWSCFMCIVFVSVFTDETQWHHRRQPPYCFHYQKTYASQRMIIWEFSFTCIVMNRNVWFVERSHAHALWRRGRDVNHLSVLVDLSRAICFFKE